MSDQPAATRDLATGIVDAIVSDLTNRAGLDSTWDAIDEAIRDEIIIEWRTIVEPLLAAAPTTEVLAKALRDRDEAWCRAVMTVTHGGVAPPTDRTDLLRALMTAAAQRLRPPASEPARDGGYGGAFMVPLPPPAPPTDPRTWPRTCGRTFPTRGGKIVCGKPASHVVTGVRPPWAICDACLAEHRAQFHWEFDGLVPLPSVADAAAAGAALEPHPDVCANCRDLLTCDYQCFELVLREGVRWHRLLVSETTCGWQPPPVAGPVGRSGA